MREVCYVIAKSNYKLCRTVGGLTGKFKRMAKLYEYFSRDWKHCLDYSDESLIELFNSESYGTPCKENNGFLVGKKWLNVTVDMWFEDLNKGLLTKFELYDDSNLPEWFLDSLFKKRSI